MRWSFGEVHRQDYVSQVTANYDLVPQPGCPFPLTFSVTYTLNEQGLNTEFLAKNLGDSPAPYAFGARPYLLAKGKADVCGAIDTWTLTAPVTYSLEVDKSMIPTGRCYEIPPLSEGLVLAGNAFGGIIREADGTAQVTLTDSDGTGTAIRFDNTIMWLQFYTDGTARRGVAVEPMTAPPCQRLQQPHESHRTRPRCRTPCTLDYLRIIGASHDCSHLF